MYAKDADKKLKEEELIRHDIFANGLLAIVFCMDHDCWSRRCL